MKRRIVVLAAATFVLMLACAAWMVATGTLPPPWLALPTYAATFVLAVVAVADAK